MTFDVAETPSRPRSRRLDRQACGAIDERAIKAHADQRFRSEYDYALFEYYRSAKVIAFLERAGVADRADACSTPAAAAAGCRCRSPKKRGTSSASIRSTASATPASGWRASGALAQPAVRARRRHGAALYRPAPSISCCRTPSSSTSPMRRCTCANARACSRRTDASISRPRRTCRLRGRICRG